MIAEGGVEKVKAVDNSNLYYDHAFEFPEDANFLNN